MYAQGAAEPQVPSGPDGKPKEPKVQRRLSDVQVEVRRAFALIDKDGDQHLSHQELKILIGKLMDREPTMIEVRTFMDQVDKDGDGKVTANEFEDCLIQWMGGQEILDKKNGMSTRQKIQTAIKKFIVDLSMRENKNFDMIRERLEDMEEDGSATSISCFDWFDLQQDENRPTPQQKVDFSMECAKLFKSGELAESIRGLKSNDSAVVLAGMETLQRLMLVKRFFNTADQRYEIKDLLIKIYEIIYQTGVAMRLFEFLDPNWLASVSSNEIAAFKYKVQWYTLEVLTAYVNGPEYSHTPPNAFWHSDRMECKKQLILLNGSQPPQIFLFRVFKHMQFSPCNEVKLWALRLIGAIAANNTSSRDLVIEHLFKWQTIACDIPEDRVECSIAPILQYICEDPRVIAIQPPAVELIRMRAALWVLSILCGHGHPPMKGEHFNRMGRLFIPRKVSYWLQSFLARDPYVVTCLANTLACFYPGATEGLDGNVARCLVNNINGSWQTGRQAMLTSHSCLRCLQFMLSVKPDDPGYPKTQAFGAWLSNKMNSAYLKSLMFMMTNLSERPDQGISDGIVSSIKSLSLKNIEMLLQLDLEHAICCDNDGMLRSIFVLLNTASLAHRAANIIKELVSDGDKKVREELIKENVVRWLFTSLSHFQQKDEIMSKLYKFEGFVYNFDLVVPVLETLHMLISDASKNVKGLKMFGLEQMEKLRAFMKVILAEVAKNSLQAWRGLTDGSSHSIEQLSYELLQKMHDMHKSLASSDPTGRSREVILGCTQMLQMWNTALKSATEAGAQRHRLKKASLNMTMLKEENPDLVLVGGKYMGVEGLMGGGMGGSMPYGPCPNGYRIQAVAAWNAAIQRVIGPFPPELEWHVLRRHITQVFGTQVIVQIKDPSSGGFVTMDSQERLQKAVARAQTIGNNMVDVKVMRAMGMNDPGLGRDGALAMGMQAGSRVAHMGMAINRHRAMAGIGAAALGGGIGTMGMYVFNIEFFKCFLHQILNLTDFEFQIFFQNTWAWVALVWVWVLPWEREPQWVLWVVLPLLVV